MSQSQAQCAHLRVSYRTETEELSEADAQVYAAKHDPSSPYPPPSAGSKLTRGWWECDDGCGTRFSPGLVQIPTPSQYQHNSVWPESGS